MFGRFWRHLRLLTGLALAFYAAPADAQTTHRFDLPTQPLERSLSRFAELTGLQMLYDSDLARGRTASAVSGQYAPREALSLMLADTGLAARFTSAGAVVIYAGSSSAVTLSPITAVAAPVIGRSADGPEARAYAGAVQRTIIESLRASPELSIGDYEISIRLWVDGAGSAQRAEILDGSGDPARDRAFIGLTRALSFGAPPPDLPQPMRVSFRVRRGD